jgi:hypothetical protein
MEDSFACGCALHRKKCQQLPLLCTGLLGIMGISLGILEEDQ